MLALVAGEGALPGLLMQHLYDTETPYRLCEMEGHASDARGDRPVKKFRIETLGSFINWLVGQGITSICFAGAVERPPLDPSKIDPATMPLVPRMMTALQQGDDAALRMVLSFFEEAGIQSVGAHKVLPDLLPPAGVLGVVELSEQHRKDAERGIQIIGAMAAADVGQSCIVHNGQALAIEARPGTDWMMSSLLYERSELPWGVTTQFFGVGRVSRARGVPEEGGILVKAAKPNQELRIDMPVIGPDTVMRAIQVGLDGIVIEAGRVMVLQLQSCITAADKAGLFLWVKE